MATDTSYTGAIVRNPGKFEGEPDYIEHYWDLMLDGGSDETLHDGDDAQWNLFFMTPDDPAVLCGHAKPGDVLVLTESLQGFAACAIIKSQDYPEWRDDNADYCHECGQIGCSHDGHDRSEVAQ